MWIGPGLVIRGLFFGIFTVLLLTHAITTGAAISDKKVDLIEKPNNQAEKVSEDVLESDRAVGQISRECAVSTNYPGKITQWCGLISEYSYRFGLEPDLVAAIIWQESGGDKLAYSRSGAVGLMQVMPKDGIAASFMCVNGPCFSNRPTIKQLENPEFNIKYGTKMLSQLVTRKGNLRDALRSYGPMDVGYSYADKVLGIYQRYGNNE